MSAYVWYAITTQQVFPFCPGLTSWIFLFNIFGGEDVACFYDVTFVLNAKIDLA